MNTILPGRRQPGNLPGLAALAALAVCFIAGCAVKNEGVQRSFLLRQPILRSEMSRALAAVPEIGRVEFHRLPSRTHLSPQQVVRTAGAHRYTLFARDGAYLLTLEMGENASQRFTLTLSRQELGNRPATAEEAQSAQALMEKIYDRLHAEAPRGLDPQLQPAWR